MITETSLDIPDELLCSQTDTKITPPLGEFIKLNAGGTLGEKAEAEGFEPSVEVLAPTTV